MEKRVPCNIEAEQGVLGSILLDPQALVQVDFLSPVDFYRDAHRTIFEAVRRLYALHEPADYITICDELERRDELETVGGASYIASLIDAVPTSGNCDYYGHIVSRTALLRRLVHAAGHIAALAYEDGIREDEALARSEQALFSLRGQGRGASFASMQEIMTDYMDELDALQHNRQALTGVTTGYTTLDILTGGLQKSDLVILAGRPGIGKTSLGLCIGYNAAKQDGRRVAVFSLEMGRKQLARRLVAMETGVDTQRLRAGWVADNEWDAIVGACGRLGNLPIWVNDTAGSPVASMRSQVRRLIAEVGGIDLIVVDFLQLIEPEEANGRGESNRVQEISKIARGLKAIAREFDVPVLALAQLSRKVEERANRRPMLSDLKESGTIEEAADIVLFLYREDYYALQEHREDYKPDGMADLTIAKHRNGATGEVRLRFVDERTMFYNVEKGQ